MGRMVRQAESPGNTRHCGYFDAKLVVISMFKFALFAHQVRTTIEAKLMRPEFLVEIDVVAAIA